MSDKPSAYDLWVQAGGDRDLYRELLLERGLLIPLKPGETAEPLPCGWPWRKTLPGVTDQPNQT